MPLPQGVAVICQLIGCGVPLLPNPRESEEHCEEPLVPPVGLIGEFAALRRVERDWNSELWKRGRDVDSTEQTKKRNP